jgi:hypothetical protein
VQHGRQLEVFSRGVVEAHIFIVRRLSNYCYDGRRTYEQKGSAMRARSTQDGTETPTVTPAAVQAQSSAAEARLAAVVEAAYILEARTR